MRYLMMIYAAESTQVTSQTEQDIEMADYEAFGREISERNTLLSGERLHPTYTATTVRVRDGDELISDGPFAETKEQLGGFYLIQCKDMQEAIGIATKNPGARTGSVEIRPIFEWR